MLIEPPAASIACWAAAEKAFASTATARLIAPFSKNLYELAAADEACSTEFLDPDLIKILGSSQGVNNIQVDCLIFDTVDVLEAKLGKTALKRHLTAFKTDLARVA